MCQDTNIGRVSSNEFVAKIGKIFPLRKNFEALVSSAIGDVLSDIFSDVLF